MNDSSKKKWLFNLYILLYCIVAFIILIIFMDLRFSPMWLNTLSPFLILIILYMPYRILSKKKKVYEDRVEFEKETKKHERDWEITKKLISKRDESKSQ
jgi:amino acid permease